MGNRGPPNSLQMCRVDSWHLWALEGVRLYHLPQRRTAENVGEWLPRPSSTARGDATQPKLFFPHSLLHALLSSADYQASGFHFLAGNLVRYQLTSLAIQGECMAASLQPCLASPSCRLDNAPATEDGPS